MVTLDTEIANRTGFREIDELEGKRQAFLFKFLDFQNAQPQTRELKGCMIELMNIQPGDCILDAGCGLGDDVREIARLVGADGQVTGVDVSTTALAEAHRRSEDLDLPISYTQGDLLNLPFEDNAFDGARSERTFMHLSDPNRGLQELVRVTRPGGRLVISDPDWGSVSQVSGMPHLTAKLHAHNDTIAPRGSRIGARLPALFLACGLEDIRIEPYLLIEGVDEWRQAEKHLGAPKPWYANGSTIALDEGYLSEEEHRTLAAHERELVEAGVHCRTILSYVVAGTVPYHD